MKLLPVLLLSLLVAPQARSAPEACGWIDFGLGWLDAPGFRHGRYAGTDGDQSFGVLSVHACGSLGATPAGPQQWVLRIIDAGLPNSSASFEIGRQGGYRLTLDQRRLSMPRGPVTSLLLGRGSPTLLLPPDWVAGTNTAALARLLPSLQPFELGSERRRNRAGLSAVLPSDWRFESRVSEETRSGLRPFAGLIGSTGGNPRVIVLPEPIETRTRDFEAALTYAAQARQARIGYRVSLFDNAHRALRWQNPYAAIPGWDAVAGYPHGFGQAQPAPDNSFQQISGAIAQALPGALRLNADIALGRLQQDQRFLPYSVNPELQESIVEPLPRSSLQGRIDTTTLNLGLSGGAGDGWRWNVGYRLDDRDNRTPSAEFVGIGGDSQQQDVEADSSRRRFNLPYSHREQQLDANLARRLGKRSRVELGARQTRTDRSFSARERTDETRAHLALRSTPQSWLGISARLTAEQRSGSTYVGNRAFLASYAPGYTPTVAGGFENLPDLRNFQLADRDRLQSSLMVNFTPSPRWSFGVGHASSRDDYRSSTLGLTAARIRSLNLDASFSAAAGWSLHAFASRDWLDFDQRGRSFLGGASRLQQAVDPERNWYARHDDRADTVGLGARHQLEGGRWVLGVDLAQSKVAGDVDVTTGSALVSAPLPASRARLGTLDVSATWRLDDRSELRVAWRSETYRSSDWAHDGVGPATLANVILLGEQSPDYRAQAAFLSLRRRF